jgi:hypothetical protein
MDNFWDVLRALISAFFFVAYLIVLFHIVTDLFSDREQSGFAKAFWIFALIFLPVLTALAYLVLRGGGMAERQEARLRNAQADADAYIQSVAGSSPADQITKAKALLDAGAISQSEFETLKAKALD